MLAVNWGNALLITGVGFGLVFLVLVLLIFIVKSFGLVFAEKPKAQAAVAAPAAAPAEVGEEERAAIWRASNIRRYALTGPSKPFGEVSISGIYPFVENVITTADRAIATGDEQATLRFAHDVTVIPFSAILGIQCANTVTDDWDNVSYKWRINEVTPMAANIQMVFYRSKKSDEILVKILHNEREQILDSAVATPVESVYYRWSDIRSYLLSKIK